MLHTIRYIVDERREMAAYLRGSPETFNQTVTTADIEQYFPISWEDL
jgi:hypothetical protein